MFSEIISTGFKMLLLYAVGKVIYDSGRREGNLEGYKKGYKEGVDRSPKKGE